MKQFILLILLAVFTCSSCLTSNKPIINENAELVKLSEQFKFTEGPASDYQGNVYFTDQPNNCIFKWSPNGDISLFMENCGRSNGLYFDNNGKLLACADENNQIWSIDTETGEVEVLVENFEGLKLNGPNDLWADSKGGIYFTDPYYQRDYWLKPEKEIEQERVYYLLPNSEKVIVVDDNILKPNGIVGTPDGKTLYVADIGDNKTYRYTINPDGTLSNRTLFCEMGSDGMTIDNQGNVYLTNNGVFIFNTDGQQIEHIEIDQSWTSNVTFGGEKQNILFITAMNSVYSLEMNVKGVRNY
ncbi:MAG TPA: SMP-30/gluconolactonase/LRE family protein [Prolixibacteraceae bacterium]|nr:SMP-30/gluconolactonase/LRE family protein [Prolixibacteraceae bacterium]